MADTTDRFPLPLLDPGQAQKELFHNEALALIDALLAPAARAIGLDAPPADAAPGDCWIVGDAPGGAWAGHAAALATMTAGGWRFVPARAGMVVWLGGDSGMACFDGARWNVGEISARRVSIGGVQVLGTRADAIPSPTGGAVADTEARQAIGSILVAMRHHGLIDSINV